MMTGYIALELTLYEQVQTLDEICFSTASKTTEEDSKALQQELSKQEEKQKEVCALICFCNAINMAASLATLT